MERPQMRRKSSAQNLLSSFKTAQGAMAVPATPTISTPKEFDSVSLYSDTTTLNNPTNAQGTSVEYLRDIIHKRMVTLTYMRSVHQGYKPKLVDGMKLIRCDRRSHWFHTILISRSDLDKVFTNVEMKKRTYRFAILGMSLSNLLEITQPQDLLKGLLATLQEYEQGKEDGDKPKMRTTKRLFRTKLASEGSLVTPHIPFPLDYHQTLISLIDVLSEVYNKIGKLLGPSPFPPPTRGPFGMLPPQPGVSYLFSDDGPYSTPLPHYASNPRLSSNPHLPSSTGDNEIGSLWSIANGFGGGVQLSSQMLGTQWTSSLGEMVVKIDGKFKKITSVLLKELDQFARNGIKEELASLDPLLRNISLAEEGGRTVYEFDGM
ncbi:hypothetical protein MIND_01006700 [Mycena indigotica]|uniref:Uncharacterized protein n=1 Tax=Mycena indigotica TaxID=2126181 RepID=A0A8H6S7Y9_9AGAR|nr:uncharacterized protein MIND_01006700 [Mycena indigotica]KAF7294695.1 hypothetical protein MIND_01006700 [Mycena indigotica]